MADYSKETTLQRLEKGGYRADLSCGDAERIARGFLAANQARMGLILMGAYGCGKSLAASILRGPCHSGIIYCDDPARVAWLDSSRDDAADYDAGGWVLDDLGREATVNSYGVRRSLVAEFIERQYRQFQRRRWETPPIITTNLDGDKLTEKYDGHIVSRLLEAFVFVKCQAGDHRKAHVTVIQ